MKRGLLEKQKVVEKLEGRGKSVLIIGPTGVGKTHLTNSIIQNIWKKYLSIREGEGLATLNTTTTVLSDYAGLNDDEIIITGKISKIDKYNRNVISECEKLLLDIMYEPVKTVEKDFARTGDFDKTYDRFKSLVEVQIDNLKRYNDNTKLAFKIKSVEGYEKILKAQILNDKLDLKEILQIFIDTYRRSKVSAKAGDIKRVFIDEIATKASLYMPNDKNETLENNNLDSNLVRNLLDVVVDTVIDIYNRAADELLREIESFDNASVDKASADKASFDKETKFTIVVNKDNYEDSADLLKKMIGVGNDTKGYYVEDLVIYVKKDFNDILNDGTGVNNDYYKTIVENDVEYHSIRIIDTQGLFHKNEEVEKECERIIDLLTKYQCNDIIFVISAKNDALTKKSKEVLKHLENTCKKNVNINLAVTHIDEKILSRLSSNTAGDFDDFNSDKPNEEDIVNEVIKDQNLELWEELTDNSGDKIKIDTNISYFSYPTHNATIDSSIKGQYDYTSNVNRLLLRVAKNSKTYFIELVSDELPVLDINSMIDIIIGNDPNNATMYDVSNIYYNMGVNYYMLFGTPKMPPLKLHHRSYEEAIISWGKYACKFKSEAQGTLTGYAPIETYFVDYMKAFIRESIVPKAVIDLSKVEFKNNDDENATRFKEELMSYLKNEVSRSVTIDIFDVTVDKHIASYDYRIDFMNILLKCAKEFFPSERISLANAENLKGKSRNEMMVYFNNDNSNGLAKTLILTILEINNAIEKFVKNYCVVRF